MQGSLIFKPFKKQEKQQECCLPTCAKYIKKIDSGSEPNKNIFNGTLYM